VNKAASKKYYTATGSDILAADGLKCWLKGGSYTPYFTYDKTIWNYSEDYKTSGKLTGSKTYKSRNKAMAKCARNPLCKSVHYSSKKYYLRTGTKLTDKDGDKAWVQGTTSVDWTKVTVLSSEKLWQPRPGYSLKGKIGKKTYKTLAKATAACIKNPKCQGVLYTKKTKTYTLRSKNSPTKTTGYIAYPRKYPCDGLSNCKAVKKGKVVTINMKYCYTLKKLEIANKQKCCSKNSGNAIIKVGSNTCGTVAMSGKTTALATECASGAKGKKITLTFANSADININHIKITSTGEDDC